MMTPKDQKKTKPEPQPAVKPEQPVATPTAPAPVAAEAAPAVQPTPTKAQATLMRLSVALAARHVEVKPEHISQDGKFLVINLGEAWPTINIGPGGGIDLPQIKSYAKAFEAAVDGDKLLARQREKGQPKPAPTPATDAVVKVVAHVVPEQSKAVTPAAKKAQQHQQIEKALEA